MSLPVRKANKPDRRLSASHRAAPVQESRVAERLGGETVVGSGAGRMKGDVRLKGLARIECKTTMAKSYALTRETIDKVENAGTGAGEVPAIVVDFIRGDGTVEHSVAVIPMWALEELLGAK